MLDGCVPWPEEFVREYRNKGYWEDKTLADHLAEWAEKYGDKPAIIHKGQEISYYQMDEYATRLAYGLAKLGLKTYDRVIVQLFNSPELVYFFYACMKIGAIPICALPLHRKTEISFFEKITNARALAIPNGVHSGFDYEEFASQIRRDSSNLKFVLTDGNPHFPDMVNINELIHADVELSEAREFLAGYRPDPMEPALFQLSGGTTGAPKLIPRTHNDYAYNAKCCAHACFEGLSMEDPRCVIAIPMMHNAPLVCGILPVHYIGGAVIPTVPKTKAILENISENKANILSVVPVFIHYLLDVPLEELRQYNLDSLRKLMFGGNLVNPKTQIQFRDRFQCDSDQVYGMAEGLICWTRPTDPFDVKVNTQGRPVSEADEIKVVDINTGEELPDGHSGECLTRGPYTIRGYYKADEHNQNAFTPDGFYRTGDLIMKEPRGNIVVLGRVKDCISRGAEKINAEEVEAHINLHPAVSASALVGMPDEVYGERVCAFVVPKPGNTFTLDELSAFLINERKIASFKVPERLEFIDELPVSSVGKFEKKTLKNKIIQILRSEGKLAEPETELIEFKTIGEVFGKMPDLFNYEKAEGVTEIYQFQITGKKDESWSVEISEGTCLVSPGGHNSPTVTIIMSDENWLDLVNGRVDGQTLLMNGQLKAEGNILAAALIKKLFSFR
jgi:2,3-dihydroxybenzoate-AMP ligase